ncbi:MAG: metallophosphoesterase [Bacteroidota bacterium]
MTGVASFLLFFVIILALFGGMQYYVYRAYRIWARLAFHAARTRKFRNGALIVLLLGNILVLGQFAIRTFPLYDNPLVQYLLIYPSGIFFASIVCGFLIIAIRDIVRLSLFWVRRGGVLLRRLGEAESTTVETDAPDAMSESRRKFLQLGGAGAIAASLGTPIFSSIFNTHDYRIVRLPLYFKKLPPGLDGFTIAQVSDVHAGIYMTESDMMEIVELTNGLHPNLIALTGDHVDNADVQIPSMIHAMKLLKSEYGVFGCLGNHDHFATAEKVSAALEGAGTVMLNNAHRTLMVNGDKLSLVGIDDAGRGLGNFSRLDEAVGGLDHESFKILLSHRPDFFTQARDADIDLTLSGHTHGGQVGIEFWGIKLNPVYLVHKYAKGLYIEDGKQLYVNVGVGVVGAPVRFIPPEITLITLHRA